MTFPSDFPRAQESQHWYDQTGKPVYFVDGVDGKKVVPDIRHARKLGLVPGYSSIAKVIAKPALERWKREQAILAALTLGRLQNETDKQFLKRLHEDAQAQAAERAKEGTAVHAAIECALKGQPWQSEYDEYVNLVLKKLDELPESFVADFKTRESILGKSDKDLFYVEHVMQLIAYRHGLGFRKQVPGAPRFLCETTFAHPVGYGGRVDLHTSLVNSASRLVSIMIGMKPASVRIKIWTDEESDRALVRFLHALAIWKLDNNYDSYFKQKN